MDRKIVFIGEKSATNKGIYQMLNRRFEVKVYEYPEEVTLDGLSEFEPEAVLVSMIGGNHEYSELFEMLKYDYAQIPVISVGSAQECEPYEVFYQGDLFHRILRPVTGKRIVEVCQAILEEQFYSESEDIDEFDDITQLKEIPHILVVDDNAMVLRNVKAILDNYYSVAVAPSGPKALVAMGKKRPDAILLDYEMPGMDGREVLETIRDDEELKDIPVIFLTGTDAKEVVMQLLSLKPAGYILKPTDEKKLLETIESVLA